MPMDALSREKLAAEIAALKRRLPIDSNDLDYETHLKTIRQLQRILDADAQKSRQKKEDEPCPSA